jgi:uncharacterized protein with PIN domain
MLGKLAKWLRLLGFDTLYSNHVSDEEFLTLAEEGRVLLTRNTTLIKDIEPSKGLLVQDNDPKIQLKQVLDLLGLEPDPEKFFTRCTLCNGVLEGVDPMDVSGRVPEYVWTAHDKFSECRNCGRIYWPGSHLKGSEREIQKILAS